MTNGIEQKFVSDLKAVVWPTLGVDVVQEYHDRLSQRSKGDYEIYVPHEGKRNVDVKAENNMPPNFPIELVQDWQSNDIGWYYTLSACDEIWYGRYVNSALESVYRIQLSKLHNADGGATSKWAVRRCIKGQGDTVFVAAPLRELEARGIAVKVYESSSEQLEIF